MPLDPSISLKAPGASSPTTNGLDPLGMISAYAGIQQKLNQNQLFQQTFHARQKMGEILSSSPDAETGWAAIMKDPEVAPFAGEALNSWRGAELARTQQQGAQQESAISGLDAFRKVLPALGADPSESTWKASVDPILATLSPTSRSRIGPAMNSIKEGLISGLEKLPTPEARSAMFKARLAGMAVASPDVWGMILGKPETKDIGGSLIPGMTSQTTGAFTPAQAPIGKSLAPTVVSGEGPGGEKITTLWGGGNGLGGGGPMGGDSGVAHPLHAPDGAPSNGLVPPATAPGYHFKGGALVGPDQSTSQYNTKRTDDIVDYEKSLDDRVGNGATLRKNIGATIDAAKQATMGGGAETYSRLGSLLQAIGVKNQTVDKWANGSLAASQVIDKVALQNSMSQLKQQLTGVGGSRLNAQEFVAYLNKNPNLTTDPRAAAEVFNLWQKFYDRDKMEQQAFDRFKAGKPTGDPALDHAIYDSNDLKAMADGQKAGDIKRWPALWNQSDFMTKFAPSGEIDTTGVKGLPKGIPKDIADIMKKHGH